MLRILVTNDDGIDALGIRRLVEALLSFTDIEIIVAAPSQEQSGVGHGITYREALSPLAQGFYDLPVQAWKVNGTPADCVKAAYHLLQEEGKKYDLVFSGVNVGNNLGRDVYYSGTCSAAREAVILGIPSVALSYDNFFHQDNYGDVVEMIRPVLEEFLNKAKNEDMPSEVFWNVNIPHISKDEVKGIAPAVLSLYHYEDKYHLEHEGYWLRREYRGAEEHPENEDYRLLKSGYITITPIHIDSTDRSLLDEISNWSVSKSWGKKV